jgi:hypothetical protein
VSIVNKVRPAVLWVGLLAVGLFSAGVGVAVLVWGVEATPGWLRALAMVLGMGLTFTVVQGTAEWAMSKRSVKQIRRHLAAGRFRDAAVELQVYVKELERMPGQYDPLTLRWTFTLAHVLMYTGHTMRALALLGFVVDAQLTLFGPDHADTRRSVRLLELAVRGDPLAEPVEIWWRE